MALPLDASTVYWNPAALDRFEQKSVTLFYTNLLGGAQYSYLGYAHPTISVGTLGFGVLRIGTGNDIDYRTDSPLSLGKFGHNEYEFLFSYGKNIRVFNLAVGGNVKVEHRSWPGLADNNYSDTAVGADLALHFMPDFRGPLKGLSTGLLIQNIVSPTLREAEGKDPFPINVKAGLAKAIDLAQWGSKMVVVLDISKAQLNPAKYHIGTEYVYNNVAMLRSGLNDGKMAFGAGAAYNIFRFDYSYASSADVYFSPNHRVSLSISFGKTKTELIEIAERQRLEEIAEEVARRKKLEIEQRIQEFLAEGKQHFKNGDYINAQIAFSAILKDDEEHEEAKEWLEKANEKYDEEEQKFWEARQEKFRLEQEKAEQEKEIRRRWQLGRGYFENSQYRLAIREWDEVLTLDPNYDLAINFKEKAKSEWRKKVLNLIAKADGLHSKKKFHEAIRTLDEAKNEDFPDSKIREQIDSKIRRYENALDFDDLFNQGLTYYNEKNFEIAMEKFEKALQLQPKNKLIQDYYNDAKARAIATIQKMPPELQQKYVQGVNLTNQGRYEEALQIFEEIRKKQPYNKRILKAIDTAEEKLNRSKKQQR